jgi:hypothetical protein
MKRGLNAEYAELRAQSSQRSVRKTQEHRQECLCHRRRGAQVVENVEIERALRTKDYRPGGQGCSLEKAQAVVVVVCKLRN